jgi:ribosomal protein L21
VTTRLPYLQWLAQVQKGDIVIPVVAGNRLEPVVVTSTSPTLITIGKYAKRTNYSRKTGLIAGNRPLKHLFRLDQP